LLQVTTNAFRSSLFRSTNAFRSILTYRTIQILTILQSKNLRATIPNWTKALSVKHAQHMLMSMTGHPCSIQGTLYLMSYYVPTLYKWHLHWMYVPQFHSHNRAYKLVVQIFVYIHSYICAYALTLKKHTFYQIHTHLSIKMLIFLQVPYTVREALSHHQITPYVIRGTI
jgi:hypothetical protein